MWLKIAGPAATGLINAVNMPKKKHTRFFLAIGMIATKLAILGSIIQSFLVIGSFARLHAN